jgi:diguanylate cyclase (GGDEF)-like protein
MTDEQIGALVSAVGLMIQLGGALLLVALFTALQRSHQRPRAYFRQWTRAWASLVVALAGVGAQYYWPELMTAQPLAPRAANFVYQSAKLLFVAMMLAGTLNFVRGARPRVVLRWAVPIAIGYALVSAVFSGAVLNAVMVFQTPLIAGPFLYCAWLLLRLPASRRTLGSRTTGGVFGAIAVIWVFYAAALAIEGFPMRTANGRLFYFLLYNSYYDLLLQMLLGYGMVVLLLEEASRENADARAQLSMAHDRLRQVSLYDALTGALNRRAYEEGVGLDALGARYGTAIVLDMDNLKVVNDTQGHAAGDELLRRLVATLRECVRPLDRIYRWGGDEFLLLFPDARPEEVVERVRQALQAGEGFEASVGAALFTGTEELPAAIARADRAMYEAKSSRVKPDRATAGEPRLAGRP